MYVCRYVRIHASVCARLDVDTVVVFVCVDADVDVHV